MPQHIQRPYFDWRRDQHKYKGRAPDQPGWLLRVREPVFNHVIWMRVSPEGRCTWADFESHPGLSYNTIQLTHRDLGCLCHLARTLYFLQDLEPKKDKRAHPLWKVSPPHFGDVPWAEYRIAHKLIRHRRVDQVLARMSDVMDPRDWRERRRAQLRAVVRDHSVSHAFVFGNNLSANFVIHDGKQEEIAYITEATSNLMVMLGWWMRFLLQTGQSPHFIDIPQHPPDPETGSYGGQVECLRIFSQRSQEPRAIGTTRVQHTVDEYRQRYAAKRSF